MESSNYHNLRKQQMVDRYSRILDEESEIIRIQNSILTNGSSTYARSTLRFPDFCTPSFVLYNLFYMSETNCIYSQVLLLRNWKNYFLGKWIRIVKSLKWNFDRYPSQIKECNVYPFFCQLISLYIKLVQIKYTYYSILQMAKILNKLLRGNTAQNFTELGHYHKLLLTLP